MDPDLDLPLDEGGDDSLEASSETTDEQEQSPDPNAALLERMASLEASTKRYEQGLQTALGRFQSTLAKLEKGSGDTDALVKQAQRESAAAVKVLDAILEDEGIDPQTKARARAVREQATRDSDADRLAQLEAEIESLRKPPQNEVTGTGGAPITTFERGIHTAIRAAGLDIDDPIFDWKGKASQVFHGEGEDATTTYFQNKIAEALKAKAADDRRQQRKDSASKQPPAAGATTDPLDPSRPLEERLKHLRAIGAI